MLVRGHGSIDDGGSSEFLLHGHSDLERQIADALAGCEHHLVRRAGRDYDHVSRLDAPTESALDDAAAQLTWRSFLRAVGKAASQHRRMSRLYDEDVRPLHMQLDPAAAVAMRERIGVAGSAAE